jgi:hypothetical protein
VTDFKFAEARIDHSSLRRSKRVVEWHDALGLRSKLTAEGYVRRLALFSSVVGLEPAEIVRRAKEAPDSFAKILLGYCVAQQQRGRSPAYIRKVLHAVKSWIVHNGVEFRRWPRVGGSDGVTVEDEQIPSNEEIRRVLGAVSSRGKVSILLMSQSGVRPGVLGSIDASDGLRLGDLPDLTLDPELKFERVPFLIRVRSSRDKVGKGYLTFGGPELEEAIVGYLHERIVSGEKLSPSSPLLASLRAAGETPAAEGRFVTTKALTFDLRDAIRGVGLRFRPYALRSRFSTVCMLGEQYGTVTHQVREFWMGHGLHSIENRYTLGKRLPENVIEKMRSAYERTLTYISTSASPPASNEEVFRIILEMNGTAPEEIGKLGTLTAEVVLGELRKAKESALLAEGSTEPGKQKVVPATAVEAWIEKGWRFVSVLNGSKAVVEWKGE